MWFFWIYNDLVINSMFEIIDFQIVFQVVEEINKLNKNSKNFIVSFQFWYQSLLNGLVYRNGFKFLFGLLLIFVQIVVDFFLGIFFMFWDNLIIVLVVVLSEYMFFSSVYVDVVNNMFKVYKDWIENGFKGFGGDMWFEFVFLIYYFGGSFNDIDVIGGSDYSYWFSIYSGVYF